LPPKLAMSYADHRLEADLDPKTHTARFALPAQVEGWFSCEWGGGRALVYVRPQTDLRVNVQPEKPRYAPGELARLRVETTLDGSRGTPAAVGLFGVDQSLEQLAPLPGEGDMARIRPVATVSSPAFG